LSTPNLVEAFYRRIWNDGDLAAALDLLSEGFLFRGSLGSEMHGREAFLEYVGTVRGALAEYHCEVLECVTEGNHAFAKMRFSGRHVALFRGYQPTGKAVHWMGAALFCFEDEKITELWVLGDLKGLDGLLDANLRTG
jgi:steroid delta-isomerase-like uncharacterized protein